MTSASILPLNTFTYDGLDFKSWSDELNKTNYLDGATVSNLTTEAGGTGAPADLKIPLGSRDKLPREMPTRSGHAFKGWQLGSDTEKLYQPRETYTAGSEIETITFTAVWKQTGEHPVPGPDDKATISSALLINSWGKMGETKEGTGETITFKPQIFEDQPQLFYKIETIQRK